MDKGRVIAGAVPAFAQCVATARNETDLRIVSGNRDGVLQLWDTQLHLLRSAESQGKGVNALAAVGGILVVGNNDGTIQPWSIETLRPLGLPRPEHTKPVVAIAAANIRNRRIVVSGADDSVRSYMLEGLLHSGPTESAGLEAGAA
jgi:WD40 repeat protein